MQQHDRRLGVVGMAVHFFFFLNGNISRANGLQLK